MAAVAAFTAERWRPTVTVTDIAGRADIALVSIPMDTDLTELVQAIMREIGGGAERALGRAQQGLDAVLRVEQDGADLEKLCDTVSQALGTTIEFRPLTRGDGDPPPGGTGQPDEEVFEPGASRQVGSLGKPPAEGEEHGEDGADDGGVAPAELGTDEAATLTFTLSADRRGGLRSPPTS